MWKFGSSPAQALPLHVSTIVPIFIAPSRHFLVGQGLVGSKEGRQRSSLHLQRVGLHQIFNIMPRRSSASGSTNIHLARRVFNRNEESGLRLAFKQLGWTETPHPAAADLVWDVWLNDAEVDQHASLVPGQLLNRFPAMADCAPHEPRTAPQRPATLAVVQLLRSRLALCACTPSLAGCRKAVFATILARLRRLLPPTAPLNDGRYIPVQFSLPRQKDALREHVERSATLAKGSSSLPRPYYIVKPDSGSQGDGIRITAEPERAKCPPGQERVVQEYIAKPMLIEGLKFDLRLYVLVADVQDAPDEGGPMRLFLCREGLARFAVEGYEQPAASNVKNVRRRFGLEPAAARSSRLSPCAIAAFLHATPASLRATIHLARPPWQVHRLPSDSPFGSLPTPSGAHAPHQLLDQPQGRRLPLLRGPRRRPRLEAHRLVRLPRPRARRQDRLRRGALAGDCFSLLLAASGGF